MTDLKETLHERADRLTPAVINYDAVMAKGDRQVRRRRAGWMAGAAAVAALAVGASSLVTPGSEHRKDNDTVTASTLPELPSYAVGSVLHRGSETVDVGREVHALVITSRGAVFTDATDQVYALVDDIVTKIGTAYAGDFNRLLVVNVDGDRVAWITEQDTRFTVSTYDVPTGKVSDVPLDQRGTEPEVRALDGESIYVQDGPRVLKVVGDQLEVIKTDRSAEIIDARAGSVSYLYLVRCEECHLVEVERPGGRGETRLTDVIRTVMSPDARYSISNDDDRARLYDNATGEGRDLSLPGWWYLAPYGWVDHDTIAGLAIEQKGDKQVSIVTCETSDATCQVIARGVGTRQPLTIAVPTGSDEYDE